ncbi:M24 family metallopeptidase [Mesorhizobium sp. M0659]|uniref:M24 family metallopeptidase n=1 Tax=Mesorhizobium sp. M0659 TaxID=2956980 RepID=UPI00333535BE
MPRFKLEEYARRLASTREAMLQRQIEVLLITSPENMNYLTGYDAWSFYTHQMAVIALDREPIWIGRGIDVPCATATSYLPQDDVIGYPDHYVQSTERHPMEFIAQELQRRGLGGRLLGVEMDNYYFTARCFEKLQASLPQCTFRDASDLVNWVRIIKSDAEIELIRQAGVIADRAMKAGIEALSPAIRQCDLAARIMQAQIAGTESFGGAVPGGLVMGIGPRADAPHLSWTEDPVGSDVVANIELGGCRARYHAGLARSVYLGNPPGQLRHLAAVVREGMEAVFSTVAPGRTCAQLEEVWRSVISRFGLAKPSRIGYSIGLGYPPDWGEHTASLRPGDMTELQPNMTFHVILGMWQGPLSFVLSETILVTERGHESFCRLPRELFVVS